MAVTQEVLKKAPVKKKKKIYISYRKPHYSTRIHRVDRQGCLMYRKNKDGELMHDKHGDEIPVWVGIKFRPKVTNPKFVRYGEFIFPDDVPEKLKKEPHMVKKTELDLDKECDPRSGTCVRTEMDFKMEQNRAAAMAEQDKDAALERAEAAEAELAELKSKYGKHK